MAALIGINRRMIASYELGFSHPSIGNLYKMAWVMERSMDEILFQYIYSNHNTYE